MVAIKDMKMPKSCHWDCPLCNEDGGSCMLGVYDTKTDTKKERAKDCPLVAIVTCKDCIHRDEYGCRHGHPNCKDNFYCADAESEE